jgi:DivIVA domain-containing protein
MSWLTRLLRGEDAPLLTASGTTAVPAPAPGAAPLTGAALRARVSAIPRTKFREGYDLGHVDAFVAQVAAALDGTGAPMTPADVLNARFKATKFAEGYDQDAIDDLLDEVVVTLRAR